VATPIEDWTIDELECESWEFQDDRAYVVASNKLGDSIEIEAVRHPDGFAICLDSDLTQMRTPNWFDKLPRNFPDTLVVPVIDSLLDNWVARLQIIDAWVQEEFWVIPSGQKKIPDGPYAALAFLYQTLGEFGGKKVTTAAARRMRVEPSTAKERIRESRVRNLLSSPGKGLGGQGKMTNKAMKILEKEGLIGA